MNTQSGYIEIDINGDVLPFKFGTNSWALFCEMHNIELYQIGESGILGKYVDGKMVAPPDVIKLRDLFHCAYVAACRSKSVTPKYNLYQFGDILDENKDMNGKLQTTMVRSKMFGINLSSEGADDANFQNPDLPGGS